MSIIVNNRYGKYLVCSAYGLLAVILMLMMAATPATAQVDFGIKAGINMSETSIKDVPQTTFGQLFEIGKDDGFFVGPVLKLSLPIPHLGIDVGAYYDLRRTDINDKEINMQSIVVPANLRFDVSVLGVLGIYLAAGPQLSFSIGNEDYDWTDAQQVRNTFRVQASSFAFNLGGGIRISDLEVGAVYQIPVGRTADIISLADAAERIYEVRSATTNTWQLTLGWYF